MTRVAASVGRWAGYVPGPERAMWPTLFEVPTSAGPIQVHTYGLAMVLAFSAAFLTIHLRAPRVGVVADRLVPGYAAAAVGGLAGGRLMYALAVDLDRTLADPSSLLAFAGFAVYGGIFGGILGVAAFVFASRLPPWRIADLAAPAVVLAMGVGRIGCFFAGCCYGDVAPIGPNPTPLLPAAFTGGQVWLSGVAPFLTNQVTGGVGDLLNVPIYPTQIWDMTLHFVLAAGLFRLWERRRFDGQIAALTLMLEPPVRSFVESFRADHRGYFATFEVSRAVADFLPPGFTHAAGRAVATADHVQAGVTTAQGFGLLMMLAGAVMYAARRNAGVAVSAPPPALDLSEELV